MNCNDFHFQRKKDILEFCEKLVHGEEEESEGRAKRSLEEKHGFMWNCNVCSEIYGNLVLQILFRQDAEVLTICIMKNNHKQSLRYDIY